MAGKRAKKAEKVDADLEIWAKLGGGSLAPERELTPGQRIMQEGNEIVRGWLAATQRRPSAEASPFALSFYASPNPFRREGE